MKIKLIELKRTCYACPSQWEGQTDDNRWVYFRYRHGYLRVEIGKEGIDVDDNKFFDGVEVIFEKHIGSALDGYMTFDELKSLTKNIIDYRKVVDDGIVYLPFWKEFYKGMKEYDLCGSLTTASSKKTFVTVLKKAVSTLVVIVLSLAVALSLLWLLCSTSTAPVEEGVMLKNSLKTEGWK